MVLVILSLLGLNFHGGMKRVSFTDTENTLHLQVFCKLMPATGDTVRIKLIFNEHLQAKTLAGTCLLGKM